MNAITRIVLACGFMIAGVTVMAIAWEFIFPGRIYFCTDDVGFGFFTPGEWVHGSIEYVNKIDTLRSMSEPDVIKAGWSEGGLWIAWWSMLAGAAVFAFVFPLLLGRAGGALAKR
ncbi:hypothetical protein [Haloferula sp. BvORR071]|uniref:hypothetical protein n=1 Tax=Haloferula sp. BvORR071 TaxID=1396141 RepID=UPI00054E828F|nr:hypothetical protein [Haloferula sp. BvORR071]